jgi:hypothetical protein
MEHISTTMCNSKRSVRTLTYHFKKLLEVACANHAYPVRHKLKDCGMMRSFMTSGSLSWGTKPDEGPDGSDTTPFPEENVVMMVFMGCPIVGRRRMSSLGPGILACGGWGCRG